MFGLLTPKFTLRLYSMSTPQEMFNAHGSTINAWDNSDCHVQPLSIVQNTSNILITVFHHRLKNLLTYVVTN